MSTPLSIIAPVSRLTTKVTDRITGDRSLYPLLVADVCVHALKKLGVQAQVMYGKTAWVEILEDNNAIWAGCYKEDRLDDLGFWVATQFGEVVDLNVSVSTRVRASEILKVPAKYAPPMLWCKQVPVFYRYAPIGVAEVGDLSPEHSRYRQAILEEVLEKVRIEEDDPEFSDEAILCPDRRILDDSEQSFKHFDRALAVRGLPKAPF